MTETDLAKCFDYALQIPLPCPTEQRPYWQIAIATAVVIGLTALAALKNTASTEILVQLDRNEEEMKPAPGQGDR